MFAAVGRRNWPRSVVGGRVAGVLALGLTSMAVSFGSADAAPQSGPLVPRGGSVAGRGYGQWVAADWQWRLSQPNTTPNKTSCITAGQRGPVWFLGGSGVKSRVITRTCSIPTGRYLMLDSPSIECSTVEAPPFHAMTDAGLMRCAKAYWQRHQGTETVTLDGVRLQPPGYLGGTAAFAFKMPGHNNLLGVPGRTHGLAAVYGAASMLQPLSAGSHTLIQVEAISHASVYYKIAYQLTVG